MTFLELCQELVGEFGLAGGTGPTSVTGNTGELANVARWIRDATLDLDNRWEDWRYLWLPYFGTLPAQVTFPTPVSQPGVMVRRWQTHVLRYRTLDPLGTTYTPIPYMAFQNFQARYDPDIATAGPPSVYTVLPDNSILFDKPADQSYQIKGAFYRVPPILTADLDVPLLPAIYHRIIRVRALKYYADKEDAPELVRAAISEYPDLLDKVEAAQLDAFRGRAGASQVTDQAGMGAGSSNEPAWS